MPLTSKVGSIVMLWQVTEPSLPSVVAAGGQGQLSQSHDNQTALPPASGIDGQV